MCHFAVAVPAFESAHAIVFADYFAGELAALRDLQEDGLVTVTPDAITVTPQGRLLIRNICMVFDRYLAAPLAAPRFSATV
jgi:oxygen-independent coproporphyrinogen-3 oxidase